MLIFADVHTCLTVALVGQHPFYTPPLIISLPISCPSIAHFTLHRFEEPP